MLLAFAALILSSCGPIASARTETGTFTYTIPPALLEQLARDAGNTTDWAYQIVARLQSEDDNGTSYFQTHATSFTEDDYDGNDFKPIATGLSFNSVPLNKTMLLRISIYKNDGENTCVWTTLVPERIKIEDGSITNVIHTKLSKPYETKYLLPKYDNGSISNYLRFNSPDGLDVDTTLYSADSIIRDYNSENQILQEIIGTYYAPRIDTYLLDENNDFWYIGHAYNESKNKLVLCKENQTEFFYSFDYNSDFTDGADVHSLCYDHILKRLITVVVDGSNSYALVIDPETLPDADGTISVSASNATLLADHAFYETETESNYAYITAAFNGTLYTLRTGSQKPVQWTDDETGEVHRANPEITLIKADYVTGECGNTTVTIPSEKDNPSEAVYRFNDMYVDDENVFILFHQEEMWGLPEEDEYDQNDWWVPLTDTTFTRDMGYINRGGIIVLNAATLTENDASPICMPEVKDNITLPLSASQTYTDESNETHTYYPYVYSDFELTQKVNMTFNFTWALKEKGDGTLANPLRIVAIKPKKLVILDGGQFFYTNGESDENYGGNTFTATGGNPSGKRTDSEGRLFTIDLENFSLSDNHVIYNPDYSAASGFKAADPKDWFYLKYNGSPSGGSLYVAAFSHYIQGSGYTGGSYALDYNNRNALNPSNTIECEVYFY